MKSLWNSLLKEFSQSDAWIDVLSILAVLLVAFFVARWLKKRFMKLSSDTAFIGQSEANGVLFPALAWFFLKLLDQFLFSDQSLPLHRALTELFGCQTILHFILMVMMVAVNRESVTPLVQRLVTGLVWLVSVLWASGLIPSLMKTLDKMTFKLGHTTLNLGALLEDAFSTVLVMSFAVASARFLEANVIQRFVKDLSIRRICVNLSRFICMAGGVLSSLSIFGLDITTLSVLGGGLGVGVGLGLQKLAANYLSGFVILLEGAIKIGDSVKIDAVEGRVADIKTRYTLITLKNGKEYLVPNESLISQRVENLTKFDQSFPMTTSVVVPQEADIAQICDLFSLAALSQERVLRTPLPVTFLSGFEGNGLKMTLNFWIADPANGKENILSAVNFDILNRMRAAGMSLPDPGYRVVLESADDALPGPAPDKTEAKTSAAMSLISGPNPSLF